MKLGKLRQVILHVADMQKQVEFYRDILGLELLYPQREDYSKEGWVAFNAGDCSFCLHTGIHDEMKAGASKIRFTFEISNVKEIRNYLLNRDVWMAEVREPAPGKFVFEIKDPEGNFISLEDFGS